MQGDFFNVFNTPGNPFAANSEGIVAAWTNAPGQAPRTVQLSARLSW
jgi:hypothetical protein